MHTSEFYVSRDGGGPKIACNIHKVGGSRPEPHEDRSGMQGAIMCLDDEDFLAMFGFIPGPMKSRKVRITVEEIPEPPPKPRLCWFERNGVKWSGFSVNALELGGLFKMKSEAGIFDGFTGDFLKRDGVEIHWYDEEPATCE